MPQIQEYLPETGAQEPIGGLDPKVEAATLFGRSVENLGQSVTNTSDLLYRRQVQKDVSDTYSTFADERAKLQQRIEDETNDGTLDIGKIQEDYTKFVDAQRDNITTSGGRDFFEKQAARSGGSILALASRNQVKLAAAETQGKWQTALNLNSSSLMSNPEDFEQTYHSSMDAIDGYVHSSSLNPKQAEVLREATTKELSKSAVRGYAMQDPAYAKQLLDSGAFDKYMDGDTKSQMYGYIHQASAAKDASDALANRTAKDEQKKAAEAWGQDAYQKLMAGKLRKADIMDPKNPLDWEERNTWVELMRKQAKERQETNPAAFNRASDRIFLPENDPHKIYSDSQLAAMASKGEISVNDYGKLSALIAKTPDGKALNQERTIALKMAQDAIVKGGGRMHGANALGEYNYMQFHDALMSAEQDYVREGKSPRALYQDPQALQSLISKYRVSPTDRMKFEADQIRGVTRPPTSVQMPPSGSPPPAPKDQPLKKAPGESPDAFLKRMQGK